jgi:hypothetical protein
LKRASITTPRYASNLVSKMRACRGSVRVDILPSSAHSDKLKQGILKGEFLRFITLCSTEKGHDKGCDKYDKALQTRRRGE